MQLCQELGVFVGNAFLFCLLPGVLPIPPGRASLDLFQTDIPTADINDADLPTVAVDLSAVGVRLTVVRECREMRLRFFTKRLTFLWRIDAGDADFVRDMVGIQQGEGVAIRDPDDPPGQRPGPWLGRNQQKSNSKRFGRDSCKKQQNLT